MEALFLVLQSLGVLFIHSKKCRVHRPFRKNAQGGQARGSLARA